MKKILINIVFSFSKVFFFFHNKIERFFREKVLTKKVIYTLLLLSVFVVATTITIPNIKINATSSASSSTFFEILNIVGGGGIVNFSIVALGISPFITASLIMMIAQTKIFPPIHRLSQSGPLGRRKINIITRILTVIISTVQAIVLVRTLVGDEYAFVTMVDNSLVHRWFIIPILLISGSLFSMFLGEQITNNGVGNGTSLIIFTGIVTQLPARFRAAYEFLVGSSIDASIVSGVIYFATYLLIFLALLFVVAYIYLAERHIPIQQTGAGLAKNEKDISYLPIKINPAGVMPLIFSLIVVSTPVMIASLFDVYTSTTRFWIENNLLPSQPIGLGIFIVINFLFSIIMGLQQSRVDKISEDFGKSSTFIPGIRPGEQTEDYLISVVLRLSFFSAIYLTLIGASEHVQQMLGMPRAITFGGTSIIILVSTALETLGQINARRKSNELALKKNRTSRAILKNTLNRKQHDGDILW
ncbi:preprotein translocase subunit SecY [Mycoplasma iguanae]|uniref:Protein translocase subunit SecY n=1 Tax=Mycoplasma iguanae TaxID=292461 RepID=A0ABY5RB07_9MOLU|nr:preprotein translocase subunit SecY [Mycoplasma iguanae]UVD81795.1 preprotein translocase subunit SecY [Mycoplasma iguanae]